MTAREKVSAHEFTVVTTLPPPEIRAAARRAQEAGARFMTSSIVETATTDSAIRYEIKGPGGVVTQMTMVVQWTSRSDGIHQVVLEVGDFLTGQSTMFLLPMGPKTAPALGSLKRFAGVLKAELEQQ